jgi:drug/metabolite transporter (DMT)-like permease
MTASTGAAGARHAYLGVACVLLATIGFSGKAVIVKLAYQYPVDVMTLLALRMICSLPFFIAMAVGAGLSGGANMTRNDWFAIVGLGFIGYYLSSYLDFSGLQYISAGLGRLILYLYPTLVLILSALFLGQTIRKRHLLSLALSYGGIALVFYEQMGIGGDRHAQLLGGSLVFASAVTYAIYLLAGSRVVIKLGSMRFTAYASIAACTFVIAHFLITHDASALAVPHPVYWLALVMAVFSTVLPMWLMAEGLRRIGANQAALVGCIGPISTIVLANLFLDEPVSATQLFGAVLVLAGVMLVSVRPKPAATQANQ